MRLIVTGALRAAVVVVEERALGSRVTDRAVPPPCHVLPHRVRCDHRIGPAPRIGTRVRRPDGGIEAP